MDLLRYEREPEGSFYRTVKLRVDEHFRTTGKMRRAGPLLAFKGALLLSLIIGCYSLILLQVWQPWSFIPLGLIFGFASLLLAINIGHDAAHQVVVRNPALNHIIQRLSFVLVGVDGYLWRLRHIKSHHLFPNVNGSDSDIDENPFVRLSPNQPWRWHFQFQHLYAPFAYLFAALQTTVWGDFVYLSKRRLANMIDIKHPLSEYFFFAVCKFTYFAVMLAIPLLVLDLPWWQVTLGFLAINGSTSFLFVVLLIGTHFADEADFPVPTEDGSVGRTWADHNMATACDWSPQNWFAHFISGGSNAHASHHLFPRVCHTHYRAIAPIIASTSAEFGVRYNSLTLWGMIKSHYRLLHQLGRRPALPSTRTEDLAHAVSGHSSERPMTSLNGRFGYADSQLV